MYKQARDKRSSLFFLGINNGEKSLITSTPDGTAKTPRRHLLHAPGAGGGLQAHIHW